MKLESYERQVNPNLGPGGGVTNVGGQQAAASMAIPGGFQPLIKGLGDYKDYEIAKLDKNINLAITEATTAYMQKMSDLLYNKDTGLMNTEYKGADGITSLFIQKEKEIRDSVFKGLPPYQKAHIAIKDMADSFVIKNFHSVETHERGEWEKNRDIQIDNYTKVNSDLAIASGNSAVLQDAFSNLDTNIATLYKESGPDFIKYKQQKKKDIVAENVLKAKEASGSIKGILDAVKVSRANGASEAVLSPYEEKAKTIQLSENMDKTVGELYKTYGGNKEQAREAYRKNLNGVSTGLDFKTMSATINSMKGVPYVWGGTSKDGVDCSGFTQLVYKSVGQDIPRTADMQLHWCETNNCLHTDKELKDIKPGDMVFYSGTDPRFPPSDDPNAGDAYAYKGVTHVGIYIGDGKVMQAGSSKGVSEMPVHTYDIVGYGSPGNKPLSEDEIKKRMDIFDVSWDKKNRAYRQEVARKADAVEKAFNIYLANNPGATTREQSAKLSSLIGDDADLKGTFGSKLASLNQRAIAEDKDEARRSNRKAILELKGAIANGTIKTDGDLANYITSNKMVLDPDQYTGICNYLKNKTEGSGEFAYDWESYRHMQEFDGVKDGEWEGAKEYAYSMINAYKNENHAEPNEFQIIQWLKKSLVPQVMNTSKGFFGGQNTRNVSPAALLGQHIAKVELVTGADGNLYYKVYRSSQPNDWQTYTPAEYDKLLKGIGR